MKKSSSYFLVLDIGTTGIKAFVFDNTLNVVSRAYQPLRKFFPKHGWVEQSPQELLQVSQTTLRQAIRKSGLSPNRSWYMGITNQRETTILWNKRTGRPVYPALVWEDTRTTQWCRSLAKKNNSFVRKRAGLSLEPYFSASKISWILVHVPKTRILGERNELLFGTVDTWMLWNILEGAPHVTDYTNASRTLLFNNKDLNWDKNLLRLFGIPDTILPQAKPSIFRFGVLKSAFIGHSLPVVALCGDQQASLFAAGIAPGVTKVTYGTGAFISQVIGSKFVLHKSFFTTLAPYHRKAVYVIEAKVNNCGQRVAKVLNKPEQMRKVVAKITAEVATFVKKLPQKPRQLIVDGGVIQYEHLVFLQSRAAGVPVKKQKIPDGTALGAAMMVRNFVATIKK